LSLRIGLCAPYDLARAGGVNSHIRAQARALARLGHRVSVFGAASAPLPAGEVAMGGCISLVVHGTETGIGIDPRAWRLVGRLLRREQLDVLHVHEPLMPLVPWCATWRSGAPIVATFHTHREHGHRFYPLARPLVAPLMRRVAKRLAVSTAARDTVARYFPGEYTIVPNGIDVGHFARPAPRPADMPIHLSLLKLRLGSLSVTRRLPQLIYEFIIGHYENGIFKRAGDIYAPGREPWPRLSRAEQMRCLHRCRKRHERQARQVRSGGKIPGLGCFLSRPRIQMRGVQQGTVEGRLSIQGRRARTLHDLCRS